MNTEVNQVLRFLPPTTTVAMADDDQKPYTANKE